MSDLAGRIKVAVAASPEKNMVIAAKMHLSGDELNEICRDRRGISSLELALLSEVTGVPVEYFLDMDTDEEALQFLMEEVDGFGGTRVIMTSPAIEEIKTRVRQMLTQAYWLGRNDTRAL